MMNGLETNPNGVVWAIANADTELGTTTLAVHLSVAFAERGHRTLLLDLNDVSDAVSFLGQPTKADTVTVRQHLDRVALGWRAQWNTRLRDLSFGHLTSVSESQSRQERTDCVADIKTLFEGLRRAYDIVLVDVPPVDTVIVATLCSSDYVLHSAAPDSPLGLRTSLARVERLTDLTQRLFNPTLRCPGIVCVETCPMSRKDHKKLLLDIDDALFFRELNSFLLGTTIPFSTEFANALLKRKSVLETAPDSPPAKELRRLAFDLEAWMRNEQAADDSLRALDGCAADAVLSAEMLDDVAH